MRNYVNDIRTVLTLDAGGTNLVFSAMRANKETVEPISIPTQADDLDKCLGNIVRGFEEVIKKVPHKPVAISFAFPGPADYANGVIGDLPNFPSFRGGIALGPYLQEKFKLPVYINNDGDLFTYGEAFAGALPEVNEHFAKLGSPRRYHNLFGVTLGTGTGGGIVRNGELFMGDNGAAAEIWVIRNKRYPEAFSEEGAAIRAIKRSYRLLSGDKSPLEPKDISQIAEGTKEGDQKEQVIATDRQSKGPSQTRRSFVMLHIDRKAQSSSATAEHISALATANTSSSALTTLRS